MGAKYKNSTEGGQKKGAQKGAKATAAERYPAAITRAIERPCATYAIT
jgi:hypothetical protein